MFAELSEHPRFAESVVYQFNGLLVVFVALGSIWVLLEIIGAFFRRSAARQSAGAAPSATLPVAPVAAAAPTVPPEIYVAIAAAVHCAYNGRARVIAVSPETSDTTWALEGRRAIFSSHHVRNR
ncbi:MAG: OadG family protein [Opitutaceae bacterium]|jgi:Na+-transporting methylmalonyl-CoA/oxaloacetate decarboxylase gamma subunit